MKRFSLLASILILMAAILAAAAPRPSSATVPAFPSTLANARYVYVASYDGDQFDTNLLPEDRSAIGAVQDAIQSWGKLTLVYEPSDADIIILVTSRPSEDLLAVYDGHGSRSNYLWRVMGQSGLQSGETPLVTQFEKGFIDIRGVEWNNFRRKCLEPPLFDPPSKKSLYDRASNFANHTIFRPRPVIAPAKCTGCGECAGRCPAHCITHAPADVFKIDLRQCVDCGCCVKVCEQGAVNMEHVGAGKAVRILVGTIKSMARDRV